MAVRCGEELLRQGARTDGPDPHLFLTHVVYPGQLQGGPYVVRGSRPLWQPHVSPGQPQGGPGVVRGSQPLWQPHFSPG